MEVHSPFRQLQHPLGLLVAGGVFLLQGIEHHPHPCAPANSSGHGLARLELKANPNPCTTAKTTCLIFKPLGLDAYTPLGQDSYQRKLAEAYFGTSYPNDAYT